MLFVVLCRYRYSTTNADGTELDEKYSSQLNAYIRAFKQITGNDADALVYHLDV
ncbi:hypothetical protein [Butyrivibrio sp. AC2005]|uniref:hypothetical protein n=1 Tax=Butyrivibrio sp. AC2005 TaxID=1280672 RepID=UPI00041D9009|nr:hypothetical protein [Butyrivibrio sp. AC2005]